MEIIGLIAISCALMCFKGGIAGVIVLWGWVLYKAADHQKRVNQREQMKRDFKKRNGYNWPMR